MKIEWFSPLEETSAVTIYSNNICLNKQASNYFLDAYGVVIGIDKETKNLVIRSVSKEESESPSFDKDRLTKISINSSYGRITGKKLIDKISVVLNLDFSAQQTYKFGAKWNTGSKMLIVECGGNR